MRKRNTYVFASDLAVGGRGYRHCCSRGGLNCEGGKRRILKGVVLFLERHVGWGGRTPGVALWVLEAAQRI